MPLMASLILRAAARAASSVAWAASRCAASASAAAAARSGSSGGAAAVSDSLTRASSSSVAAAATTTARSPASSGSVHHPPIAARLSGGSGSSIATSPNVFHPNFLNSVRVLFEADEKDLESDEALWALYERWCKFFNVERDRDEMARRFSYFKQTVMDVEENKKSGLPYRIGINLFADGKLADEMHFGAGGATHSLMSLPYSKSPVYVRRSDFLFKEDPKELDQATSATEASNKELGQATSATEASNPSA